MKKNKINAKIYSETKQILLSQKDYEIFLEAITNPKVPNDALKKAANKFKPKMIPNK